MNRQQIETVQRLAVEVVWMCDDALEQIEREREAMDEFFERESGPRPTDRSSGSPQTAALRRRSMDLTRALADLRR